MQAPKAETRQPGPNLAKCMSLEFSPASNGTNKTQFIELIWRTKEAMCRDVDTVETVSAKLYLACSF